MGVVGVEGAGFYGVADGGRSEDGLGIVDFNHACGGSDIIQSRKRWRWWMKRFSRECRRWLWIL